MTTVIIDKITLSNPASDRVEIQWRYLNGSFVPAAQNVLVASNGSIAPVEITYDEYINQSIQIRVRYTGAENCDWFSIYYSGTDTIPTTTTTTTIAPFSYELILRLSFTESGVCGAFSDTYFTNTSGELGLGKELYYDAALQQRINEAYAGDSLGNIFRLNNGVVITNTGNTC